MRLQEQHSLRESPAVERYQSRVRRILQDDHFRCSALRNPDDALVNRISAGSFDMVQFESGPHTVTRAASPRSRHVYLILQASGTAQVFHHGRNLDLGAGDLIILDGSASFEIAFLEPTQQVAIRLRHNEQVERLLSGGNVSARRIDGSSGTGRLARDFVMGLLDEAANLGDKASRSAGSILVDLARSATLLDASGNSGNSTYRNHRLNQLDAYIGEHLRDPGLKPADIAAALNVSLRALNMLLADEKMSVGRRLWAARLERSRAELRNPAQSGLSITEIAHGCGFKCSAHFSRSFRKHFGTSPSEVRSSGTVARPN